MTEELKPCPFTLTKGDNGIFGLEFETKQMFVQAEFDEEGALYLRDRLNELLNTRPQANNVAVDVPDCGDAGGPITCAKVLYEDGTEFHVDGTVLRQALTSQPEAVDVEALKGLVERIKFQSLGYRPDEPGECFRVDRDTYDAVMELIHLKTPPPQQPTLEALLGAALEDTQNTVILWHDASGINAKIYNEGLDILEVGETPTEALQAALQGDG